MILDRYNIKREIAEEDYKKVINRINEFRKIREEKKTQIDKILWKNIKTKFILKDIFDEIKSWSITFEKISLYMEELSEKDDLLNHQEDFYALQEYLSDFFYNKVFLAKNIDIIVLMKSLVKLVEINESIFNKEFYNSVAYVIINKSLSNDFSIFQVNEILNFFEENNPEVINEKFIDFIAKNIIIVRWGFDSDAFESIMDFIFNKKNNFSNIFIKKVIELDQDINAKNACHIVKRFKDFTSNEIDKNTIEYFFNIIKNKKEELDINDMWYFLLWLTMMDQENVSKDIINFWLDIIKNNKKNIKFLDHLSIMWLILSLQNIKKEFIKENYIKEIIKLIKLNLETIDILTARSILYYSNNLENNEAFKEIEEDLFKIIEIESTESLLRNQLIFWENSRLNIYIIWLIRVYNIYNRKIPEKFKKMYEIAKKDKNIKWNSINEKILYKFLSRKFKNVKMWFFVDGFEMDIFLKDFNLNIEIDWPSHYWMQLMKDKIRDDYLNKKWIKVIRIKWSKMILEEILKEIEKVVII